GWDQPSSSGVREPLLGRRIPSGGALRPSGELFRLRASVFAADSPGSWDGSGGRINGGGGGVCSGSSTSSTTSISSSSITSEIVEGDDGARVGGAFTDDFRGLGFMTPDRLISASTSSLSSSSAPRSLSVGPGLPRSVSLTPFAAGIP